MRCLNCCLKDVQAFGHRGPTKRMLCCHMKLPMEVQPIHSNINLGTSFKCARLQGKAKQDAVHHQQVVENNVARGIASEERLPDSIQ